tara:strand:- start:33 stop:161 length:129 start_codon:yes stop_codon:yes gene_type:complete
MGTDLDIETVKRSNIKINLNDATTKPRVLYKAVKYKRRTAYI